MLKKYYKTYLLLLCIPIISLTSCSSLNAVKDAAGIKNPSINLSGMKITNLTAKSADLALTLNIDNPNPVPISLAGFDYALLFDGKQLLAGKKRDKLKINARGVSAVTVPVSLIFADLKKLYQDGIMTQDNLNYELKTTALIDLPVLGVQKFPSSKTGTFPIPKAPKVSLSDVDVKKMGFSGAEIMITAKINNPNSFGVDISQLAYHLSINGSKWVESVLTETIKLAEKSESQIQIPIKLNFMEMGGALYSALVKKEGLNYQLTGDMNLDTALPLLKNVNVPFDKRGIVAVRR